MMDQSYSDSDITMSPSQILERLQMLRHLQNLQKGKLKKQQLQYDSSEITSSITEIVSHFSDSTSYNTFRTLLQSSHDIESEQLAQESPQIRQEMARELMEGVKFLNLSQDSEVLNHSPTSTSSGMSSQQVSNASNKISSADQSVNVAKPKIQISLDEMPILSPRKDFESLIDEKLKKEALSNKTDSNKSLPKSKVVPNTKRPFLKRGEGMARFGINKNDLIIQNTKNLPWKRGNKPFPRKKPKVTKSNNKQKDMKVQILVSETKCKEEEVQPKPKTNRISNSNIETTNINELKLQSRITSEQKTQKPVDSVIEHEIRPQPSKSQETLKQNQPAINTQGKTWAAVLSKAQNDLLMQLKQSDYYKNFLSPTKSIASDISCNENMFSIRQEKETAEQNLFELLERKVNHDSFHLENSFFNRFLGKSSLESSGESTPLILKKCISNNPKLMNIAPRVSIEQHSHSEMESCDCVECSDTCSSVSTCCSCKTMTQDGLSQAQDDSKSDQRVSNEKNKIDNVKKSPQKDTCQDNVAVNNDTANMVEMNAKLIATSELLKDRLKELEDEIETFRRENLNLTKMREEIDQEKQKFYEEKQEYEKKFNEEKILSEYYIAEEKEKLQTQKQMYERYVRDMRGRLNKKEKDEVINLKKEIQDLKEDIRVKDAKSTSTIGRLRNQIKIIEKEKKALGDEVENLKKENRRIQHSNDITRRLTNIKYLEQINKKLTDRTTKDAQSNVIVDPDIKYRAHAIERQSRVRNIQPTKNIRPRAKSVPNLKVTSRYAKYFSQKDSYSDIDKLKELNNNSCPMYKDDSDNETLQDNYSVDNNQYADSLLSDEDNNLEKLYNDRFKAKSLTHKGYIQNTEVADELDDNSNYFVNKNTSVNSRQSKSSLSDTLGSRKNISISNLSKSPNSLSSSISSENSIKMSETLKQHKNTYDYHTDIGARRSINKSPVSILSNHSLSQKTGVINKPLVSDLRMIPSPEPSTSRSSLTKTNLNPTEIIKPDGSKELRFPNGNVKIISADGKYSKFIYYNGDIKENFYNEGRIKYYYAETKTYHTTHADGLEVLEFPDGQIEKRYKDGSSEIRLPNGSIRYFDPKNEYVREEWRFPDGAALTISANGEQRVVFPNGQVEVHTKDHKRREFPDGTVKLVYNDGTSETRYSSGRIRIKDKHGNLIMDSAPG